MHHFNLNNRNLPFVTYHSQLNPRESLEKRLRPLNFRLQTFGCKLFLFCKQGDGSSWVLWFTACEASQVDNLKLWSFGSFKLKPLEIAAIWEAKRRTLGKISATSCAACAQHHSRWRVYDTLMLSYYQLDDILCAPFEFKLSIWKFRCALCPFYPIVADW